MAKTILPYCMLSSRALPLQAEQREEHSRWKKAAKFFLGGQWRNSASRLRRAGVYAGQLSPARRQRVIALPEEVGVRAALLVAAVAPLRKFQRIEQVAAGVAHVSYEEACYWYAHIRSDYGRRALRILCLLLAPE